MAVSKVWELLPEEAKSKLEKAGWRGSVVKPKEVVAPLDPLLLLLKQHEDQLPDAIKTAVQEATQNPDLAVGKKTQQSTRLAQTHFASQGLGPQEDQASGDH